jgi:hypothetical protein
MKNIKVIMNRGNKQVIVFRTNDMELAKASAMSFATLNNTATFIWRNGQRACSYWVHPSQGTFTMYRGAGRK